MVGLSRCLVPDGWVSDLDRVRRPLASAKLPESRCLDRARAYRQSSQSLSARLDLLDGDIAARRDQWAMAILHYRAAIEGAPIPRPGIWNDIVAIDAWKLKDYEAARIAALEGLRDSPGDQDLRMSAAMMYLYYIPPYSRYREAIEVMRPELGFRYPYYYNIAAGTYLGLGEWSNGLRMAQEGVRLARATKDPNLATGLYLTGVLQRCAGENEAGVRTLREAASISPDDKVIQAGLAENIRNICGDTVAVSSKHDTSHVHVGGRE
jgi:hypothetical protein